MVRFGSMELCEDNIKRRLVEICWNLAGGSSFVGVLLISERTINIELERRTHIFVIDIMFYINI